MNKVIFKILIGAFLIAIIVLWAGQQFYNMKQTRYRQQLENTINNKCLEGKNSIGAFRYNAYEKDSTSICKVSDYNFEWSCLNMHASTMTSWGGLNFDHTDILMHVLKSGKYEWYEFNYCATSSPFMIIVRKTDRGYDIIGEYILGIGLTSSYPSYLITDIPLKYIYRKPFDYGEDVIYEHRIKTDMIYSYINNLFENKYGDVTIRNEIAGERNIKMEMLNDLVMKDACPADSSLFYRVNKYFELKLDDEFTTMGSHPIVWQTGSYGNQVQTVFTKTVTTHYSIQENKGVLEDECKNRVIIFLLLLESLYILLSIIVFRKKRNN